MYIHWASIPSSRCRPRDVNVTAMVFARLRSSAPPFGKHMGKYILAPCVFLLFSALSSVSPAQEPDTLYCADISRDAVAETPKEWTNVLAKKQRVYANYTVEYLETGPYIRAESNSAGSWIERDMADIDPAEYPVMQWDWMTEIFPDVSWERNPTEDDFAIRIEIVYGYRGNPWNPLNIMRRGLISSLFRRSTPVLVVSYVWSVGVPVGISYQSPESNPVTVIPVESGTSIIRRWLHESRDINVDLERIMPKELNLGIESIRIRSDSDNSGSRAAAGIKNIRFIHRPESLTGGKR
jgi:hypothetical protein